MFKFRLTTHLQFGVDICAELGKFAEELGYQNLGVIVDSGIFNHPQVKKTIMSLKAAGLKFKVFKNTAVEPTYDYLDKFKKKFIRKDFQCLVGIGGGSTLDLTKGIATLIKNPGPAINYRGFPKLKKRPLPVIAIPTTAGTGSEVTYNAVFTDSKQKKKLGINSEFNYPVLAIIDPLMTMDCPKQVTVSSGVDALVHTLESYVHKNHTPISRIYSKEAFRLLYNNLWKVLDEPHNVDIRANLALGAYLAGTALINAGSGPAGAFSYPLGVFYNVPHGYAGGVFLSSVTRMNVEKGYQDYALLYDLIDGVNQKLSPKEKNREFAKKIQELMDKLSVPKSLSDFKLKSRDIEFMIEQYDVLKTAIAQNPVEITRDDVRRILMQLS